MPKRQPVPVEEQARGPRGAASPTFLLAQVGAHEGISEVTPSTDRRVDVDAKFN